MSLREVLDLSKIPVSPKVQPFESKLVDMLVSLVVKLTKICQDHEVDLHRLLHCFDMRSNEWHIAMFQVYKTLFDQESQKRFEKGELKFDKAGNLIERKSKR